jgi:RNA-directed DNA polymerase
MSCVPPSAATAASKRPPSRCLLDGLVADEPWHDAAALFATRNPRRRERIDAYDRLLDAGEHLRIGADVLAGRHHPAPPVEGWLNKADGRKKRVFQYPPADELLFRVVNRLLQPTAAEAASPWCRSFLPGGGARAVFRGVLVDRSIDGKAALRLDVRDYFNSIDPTDVLARLPEPLASGPVATLLAAALLDRRVRRGDEVVDGGRKGLMAGTPLAPLLATLYLRDVDGEVAGFGGGHVTYARYSDDIVVLADPAVIPTIEGLLRARLAERGLAVNESKSSVTAPGEPWDFLGFRYHAGQVGLAPLTSRKMKARTTRLARRLLRWRERRDVPAELAVGTFVRRLNLRLYGVPSERAEFSWATWFLPLLDRPDELGPLDEHAQREARYVGTGRRTGRARERVPYASLTNAGHLPLVPAYWALRDGGGAYEALVARRTRLNGRD